ncbi:MAG: cell division protein ZapA [Rhodospirillales bacterium]|jgi:cell division protein ZapA|nr:cell division protein ZapA [Rhodospirillales bacterium]
MAQVTVTINDRRYNVACDDGQEAHLSRLGAYIDRRVSELVAAVGQIGDAKLLVMVSLLIADELSDAYAEMETIKSGGKGAAAAAAAETRLGESLEKISERIESIAESLERT